MRMKHNPLRPQILLNRRQEEAIKHGARNQRIEMRPTPLAISRPLKPPFPYIRQRAESTENIEPRRHRNHDLRRIIREMPRFVTTPQRTRTLIRSPWKTKDRSQRRIRRDPDTRLTLARSRSLFSRLNNFQLQTTTPVIKRMNDHLHVTSTSSVRSYGKIWSVAASSLTFPFVCITQPVQAIIAALSTRNSLDGM